MDLISFVFGVLEQTSPMTQEEAAKLRVEIDNDWKKVVTDPEHEGYQGETIKVKIIKFFRNPWVRLALAAFFLAAIKLYKDWYNGKFDDNKNQDE